MLWVHRTYHILSHVWHITYQPCYGYTKNTIFHHIWHTNYPPCIWYTTSIFHHMSGTPTIHHIMYTQNTLIFHHISGTPTIHCVKSINYNFSSNVWPTNYPPSYRFTEYIYIYIYIYFFFITSLAHELST